MTRRRELITALVAAAATLAGCAGQTGSTENKTTTRTGTTSSTRTATTTTTDARPPFNETPHAVFRSDVKSDGITKGHSDDPVLVLLTTVDWKETVYEQGLRASTRSFIEETDFSSEAVVGLQENVGAGLNRWIVESVDGIGTTSLELRFRLWESGSGLNNDPRRLVLVRIPNRGTKPTKATAHLQYDADSTKPVSTSH